MRCNHCGTAIDSSWRFCVRCGSSTARFVPPGDDVELPSVSTSDGSGASRRSIDIRNDGWAPLRVRLALQGGPSWARLVTATELRLDPQADTRVGMELRPPKGVAGDFEFELRVQHDDATRSSIENGSISGLTWQRTSWATTTVQVRVLVAERESLQVEQQLLVFSYRRTERTLTLRNPNGDDAPFAVRAPHGVEAEIVGTDAMLVPGRNGSGPGRADLRVRVDPVRLNGAPAHELIVASGDDEQRIRVHVLDGGATAASVPLVIGVDFGTDNTSVFARVPGSTDPPEPVPILGSHEPRVPSYLAYERSGSVPTLYGQDAKDLLSQPEKLQHDYRIEYDVKRWLRVADEDARRRGALRDYLKRLYLDIDTYLKRIDMAQHAGIQFVFTLPVLDQAELYDTQRRVMRDAILEAFGPRIQRGITSADDFTFVTEPQAAAACFLFDDAVLTELGLPGYEENDLIAVVDSGAGTTDLALVQVTSGSGIDRFAVLGVYGTDLLDDEADRAGSDVGAFGGRWVDDQIYDLMVRSAAEGINRAFPETNATPESMRIYLQETLKRAGLDHTSPEKYVEMVKPRLFTKSHAAHKVQIRQVPLIKERALDPSIDEKRFLPSFAATVGDFDDRLRQTKVLDRLTAALESMMTDGASGELIQRLPPEQRHIRYIFAVGGNSHLPQLTHRLSERFPGSTVLPSDSARQFAGETTHAPVDASSIRMTAVARGSVWSVGHDGANLMPFRLTLRAGDRGDVVLLRENSPFSMALPVQTFQVRRNQPYVAEVRAWLSDRSYRIGTIRYHPQEATHELVRRRLRFELDSDWVLTAYVGGDGEQEEVLRYGLR